MLREKTETLDQAMIDLDVEKKRYQTIEIQLRTKDHQFNEDLMASFGSNMKNSYLNQKYGVQNQIQESQIAVQAISRRKEVEAECEELRKDNTMLERNLERTKQILEQKENDLLFKDKLVYEMRKKIEGFHQQGDFQINLYGTDAKPQIACESDYVTLH